MARSIITGLTVEPITEKTGIFGQKTSTDIRLRMETPRGNIYLRKSVLEAAGDCWERLIHGLEASAKDKGIPFSDGTV